MALEQLLTTDKHSYHHGLHLHTPLLTAAAMVIRLSPKASRPFPAARFRAGTYRERLGAGWRDLWRHLQEWFLASRVPRADLAATLWDQTSGGAPSTEKWMKVGIF